VEQELTSLWTQVEIQLLTQHLLVLVTELSHWRLVIHIIGQVMLGKHTISELLSNTLNQLVMFTIISSGLGLMLAELISFQLKANQPWSITSTHHLIPLPTISLIKLMILVVTLSLIP